MELRFRFFSSSLIFDAGYKCIINEKNLKPIISESCQLFTLVRSTRQENVAPHSMIRCSSTNEPPAITSFLERSHLGAELQFERDHDVNVREAME